MGLKAINHLAFITDDLEKTIRFYRDLLGLPLSAGIGHDGYRHYFFKLGQHDHIAFFEYEGASPMERKFPGVRTEKPLGFDHVSFTVDSLEELLVFKQKLEAAELDVHGVVDHGIMMSIYFYDPNNIPLEITWDCVDLLDHPAIVDDAPLPIAAEGSEPQPGHWPTTNTPVSLDGFAPRPGNGHAMRAAFVAENKAKPKDALVKVLGSEET